MRRLSLTALAIIGLAAIAEAQSGWSGTVSTISTPVANYGRIFTPVVAVDPNGNAYAIWNQIEGLQPISLIKAARYVAATDSWNAPTTLAGPGDFDPPEVAVDPFGNAFFLVTTRSGGRKQIHVLRYTPASGTTTTTTLALDTYGFAAPAQIVVDAAGNAMVVWDVSGVIEAARYDYASATWSSPLTISIGETPLIAIDGHNDITAIWRFDFTGDFIWRLQAARFDSSTLTWSQAVDLAEGFALKPEDIATDHAGNVTAIWETNFGAVHAARFEKAIDAWGGVTNLSQPAATSSVPSAAADPDGNVTVVWRRAVGSTYVIQTRRYDSGSASWGSVLDLSSPSGFAYPRPQVQSDAFGNAIAVWGRSQPGLGPQIQAARYTAVANQWSAPVELSAAGQAAYNPDIRFDPAGNATAVWFQAAFDLGAIQSTRWVEQPPVPPDPPTDLVVASVTGNTVTLAWKAPANGTATGYVLEGGLSPGGVLASIATGSTATTFTFDAPSGVFFARLHALSGNVRSAASNEIQLIVNAPLPPSAPANVLGLVNGSTVALSWTNTFAGGAPTALHLNVTGYQTVTIPLAVSDTVSFDGVLGGTYTLTLTASNAAGVGPPSDPVTLTVPGSCSGPPGAPTYFAITKSGSTLTLTWNPPVSGTAVTSYVIHASGAFTGSLPTLTRSFSATVGSGTYSVSVVAANTCGTSAPTDSITVTVP
jgi:hypothetical protein